MNKTAKGALAASAAAVLLTGGVGTLAYWTDTAIVDGGSVNSGFLTIDAVPVSADRDCTPFVYATGFKGGETPTSAAKPVVNFVPGDVISTKCTFVIGAQGDNLAATPTIDDELLVATASPETVTSPQVAGSGASFSAAVTADYTLGGAVYNGTDVITEADNGKSLVATITVKLPYGTDETGTPIVNGNQTQNIKAALRKLTVSLKQDRPNAGI